VSLKGRLNTIFTRGVLGSNPQPTAVRGLRSPISKHFHSQTVRAARAGTLLMHAAARDARTLQTTCPWCTRRATDSKPSQKGIQRKATR